MKATHWSVEEDPELWSDDPAESPEKAAAAYLDDYGDAPDDDWYDLRHGPITVTAHGYIETSEPLPDDQQFDGYEPGCKYFAPTKESVQVRVSLNLEAIP
jgi:hypothetical protein